MRNMPSLLDLLVLLFCWHARSAIAQVKLRDQHERNIWSPSPCTYPTDTGECDTTPKRHGLVCYYNRHIGTMQDFKYVTDMIGVRMRIERPSWTTECRDKSTFSSQWALGCWKKIAKALCREHDVIVVGDSTPDSRPYLEGGCEKPIIIQITNRFDFHIRDQDRAYYEMIRAAIKSENVFWVANNPFEKWYLEQRVGVPLPTHRYWLIRPTGHTKLRGLNLTDEEQNTVALVTRTTLAKLLGPVFAAAGLPVKLYKPSEYGGPLTLAQHTAVIEFPYQVSTMALYENLAHGVTYFLPSATFLPRLSEGLGIFRVDPVFYKNVEWFHEDFKDLFVYFDSWEQLFSMLRDKNIRAMTRERGKRAIELFEKLEKDGLGKWSDVLARAFDRAGVTSTGGGVLGH